MSLFNKFWKEDKADNLDGFFAALGMPEEHRQKYLTNKAKFRIEKDGDNYTNTFVVADKTRVEKFTSGVEFVENPVPGIELQTVATVDGNVVSYVQRHPGGKIVKQKKELVGDKAVITLEIEGWNGKAVITHTAE